MDSEFERSRRTRKGPVMTRTVDDVIASFRCGAGMQPDDAGLLVAEIDALREAVRDAHGVASFGGDPELWERCYAAVIARAQERRG